MSDQAGMVSEGNGGHFEKRRQSVDYLGLLDTTDLDRTVYAQVSKAARNLKTLAKKMSSSQEERFLAEMERAGFRYNLSQMRYRGMVTYYFRTRLSPAEADSVLKRMGR